MQIEGEMTIFNAAEIKKQLFDNFAGCSEFELDLSRVSEMDTSGFQLLYLAKKESARLNKPVRIVEQSTATSAVLELFNIKPEEL
jgi:anti-anti-sigma factor